MAKTNNDEELALAQHPKDFKEDDDQSHQSEEPNSGGNFKSSSFELNQRNVAILAVTLVIIVLIIVFSTLLFTTKTPQFRVRSVLVHSLNHTTTPNPSFHISFVAHITVKNPNFGNRFRYETTNVGFGYRGQPLGQVWVPRGSVRGLGTRSIVTATIELNSNNVRNDTNLGSDLRSGFLVLSSQSQMKGKVYLASSGKRNKVVNGRRRSATMNCNLTFNLADKLVRDIKCA